MKQSSTSSLSAIFQKLAPHLRNATKLRLLLCVTMVGGWYAGFYSPLSDQLDETKRLIAKERKRVAVAREIEQLKGKLKPYEECIPADAEAAELRPYVMNRIRRTPLKLHDITPEKSKDIGPFESAVVRLNIEGKYNDIDDLLAWVETDKRLLRVDSIKLARSAKNPSHLQASLVILGLNEKAASDTAKPSTTEPLRKTTSSNEKRDDAAKVAINNATKPAAATKKADLPQRKPLAAVRKKIAAAKSSNATAQPTANSPATD